MTIPRSILAQGAPVVYGWLHYHARRADYAALTYGRWSYPEGLGYAVEHPTALRLRALAARLFRLRNRVGKLLTLHGGRYVPHPMDR